MDEIKRARNDLRTAICNMPLECPELTAIANKLGLCDVLMAQGSIGIVLDQLINENGLYDDTNCYDLVMAISNAKVSRESNVAVAAIALFLTSGYAMEDLPHAWHPPSPSHHPTSQRTRYAELMSCIGNLDKPACLSVVRGLDKKGSHDILAKKFNRASRGKGGDEPGVCLAALLESDYDFNSAMSPASAKTVQELLTDHIRAETECVNAFANFISYE